MLYMEQQFQINSSEDLKQLFEIKKNETVDICKEIAETEFDLFEFSLFLASFGKDKLDESTKKVKKLREQVDKGKINLSEYEDMLDDY